MTSKMNEYRDSITKEKHEDRSTEDTVEVAEPAYHAMLASAQREQELQYRFRIGFDDVKNILTDSFHKSLSQANYTEKIAKEKGHHSLWPEPAYPSSRDFQTRPSAQTQRHNQWTDQVPPQYVSEEILKTLNVIRGIRSLDSVNSEKATGRWYSHIINIYEKEDPLNLSYDDILLLLEAVQETQADSTERVKSILYKSTESLMMNENFPNEEFEQTWTWQDLRARLETILDEYEQLIKEISRDDSEFTEIMTNYTKAGLLTHLKKL